ncbi:MAG TPA: thiamine phosphate synthase [Acidobacteriaceae bacterium]|nr:thiamine phosphate synthase [Acidobacteriaceae bacterium]
MNLSPLYAIIDADILQQRGVRLRKFAVGLRAAGVTLIQYRNKTGAPQDILAAAACLREVFVGLDCQFILNDRPDLAVLANFHGVHVGQTDLSPEDARRVIGPDRIVGISTHTDDQVRAANLTSANYIAIGPIFPTTSKENPDPVVGLEGLHRARTLTTKPLVAIGGITRANAPSVIEAGANSVAVISSLFAEGESVQHVAQDFLTLLG